MNKPIDIVLYCPKCNTQHIDRITPHLNGCNRIYSGLPPRCECGAWQNPPHKSHLCLSPDCGHIWRPSDHPTNGVLRTNSGVHWDTRPVLWTAKQVNDMMNRHVNQPPLILTEAARIMDAQPVPKDRKS